MQLRNVIRLAVAVAAVGILIIAVVILHSGGDVQTAGNAARASLAALALVIASLYLEAGRAVDALAASATGQAAQLQGFEDQIERDAKRVRKLCTIGWNVAFLLFLPVIALVWYYGNYLTALIFGTPDTRFIMTTSDRVFAGIIYVLTLMASIKLAGLASLLVSAKVYPLGAARAASQEEPLTIGPRRSVFYNPPGGDYQVSRIASCRLLSALLAAFLLADLLFVASYVRVTDRGIGVVYLPGTTEVSHPWTDISSITETHYSDRSGPVHRYVIQFKDGSEWQDDDIPDNPSPILGQPDPGPALMFAAKRAKLPFGCSR